MWRLPLILSSIMLYSVGVACAQELPEQFRIWGKTARKHPYLVHPEQISTRRGCSRNGENSNDPLSSPINTMFQGLLQ